MFVRGIVKYHGKQVGLVVDDRFIKLSDAIKNADLFQNVSLVNNKFFRGKNCKIPVKEVDYYDESKGIEQFMGKVRNNGMGKTGRVSNSRGVSRSKGCNRSKEGIERGNDRRRGRGSGDSHAKRGKNSGGRDNGVWGRRGAKGTSDSIQLLLKKSGVPNIFNKSDPEDFHKAFVNARDKNPNALCVDVHSVEELKDMKCLELKDGVGFVAVESNGNINSVLKDYTKPASETFLRDLLLNAVEHGGRKLDCFAIHNVLKDTYGLADMYCKYGFIPVCRDKFNRDFAPDGWDYRRNGEPDVVFMYFCGDSIEEVMKKSSNKEYKSYKDYEVPYITDTEFYIEPPEDYDWDEDKQDMSTYSQAMRYRDYIMERNQRW